MMLHSVLLCSLLLCSWVVSKHATSSKYDLEGELITSLRADANLDLSEDEEYEDLRAELLAYHTALASLTSARRSMKTTPCWDIGGICVNYELCTGYRYLTEVPGCKRDLQVCCFTWNRYKVRDMKDKGIDSLAMPWSNLQEFGGLGVVDKVPEKRKKQKSRLTQPTKDVSPAVKYESSAVKYHSPAVKYQSPAVKYQSPAVKDDSPALVVLLRSNQN